MAKKQIFVNLPVKDLAKATAFYEGLGFAKNPMFSDDKASCVAWSEEIIVMLLTEPFYRQFIPGRDVADGQKVSEVALCISFESRQAVQEFADKARSLGGHVYSVPMVNQHEDSMFGLSVQDLDGHLWEPMWMDISKFQKQ